VTQNSNSNTYCSLPHREGGGRVLLSLSCASIAFDSRPLFSGLDLTIDRGQLVGVTGESGTGKTSLLRAIVGVIPITSGSIEVCGLPLDVHHIHEIRQKIAYVPQELQPAVEKGGDLISLTHDLSYNLTLHQTRFLPVLMDELAVDVSFYGMPAAQLSGGQRQRMLLMAALLLPKPVLLLDEPTSALDEENSRRVALALQRACHDEGRAALVVSHDPVLLSYCDRIITLPNNS